MEEQSDEVIWRYEPKPLPKEALSGEYQPAYVNLKRFVTRRISELETIEQAIEQISTIGQDLATVVSANGAIEIQPNGDITFIVSKEINATRTEVIVDAAHTTIHKTEMKGTPEGSQNNAFQIRLPSDSPINPTDKSFGNTLRSFAVIGEDNRTVLFLLRIEDKKLISQFTSLLQEGIANIMPNIAPPTKFYPDI